MFRPSHVVVGALALMAACSDSDNVVHTLNSATVRLVNDTDTPLSLVNGGILDSVSVGLVFGQASACVFVDLNNTLRLTITDGAGATIGFTPILSPGDNLTVVAFAPTVGNVATMGNVQFATLNNRFVPRRQQRGIALLQRRLEHRSARHAPQWHRSHAIRRVRRGEPFRERADRFGVDHVLQPSLHRSRRGTDGVPARSELDRGSGTARARDRSSSLFHRAGLLNTHSGVSRSAGSSQ